MKRLAGDDTELPEWHLHDLRRTCATRMGGLKVERLTISKILNHAEGGVTRVYDLERYRPEKASALEQWGLKLGAIINGANTSNAIELAKAGA